MWRPPRVPRCLSVTSTRERCLRNDGICEFRRLTTSVSCLSFLPGTSAILRTGIQQKSDFGASFQVRTTHEEFTSCTGRIPWEHLQLASVTYWIRSRRVRTPGNSLFGGYVQEARRETCSDQPDTFPATLTSKHPPGCRASGLRQKFEQFTRSSRRIRPEYRAGTSSDHYISHNEAGRHKNFKSMQKTPAHNSWRR